MTEFVLKLSNFCNLRCAYCYEWDRLSNPERMSLENVERTLDFIREHELAVGAASTSLILHGGEPLALPVTYLSLVLESIRLRWPALDSKFRLNLQTNLYSIQPARRGERGASSRRGRTHPVAEIYE